MLTVTYSHAVPMIREKLIRACGKAHDAKTIRDRKAAFAEAYAYADVLNTMWYSEDTRPLLEEPGVFQPEYIPSNCFAATRDFIKLEGDRQRLLGAGWDDVNSDRSGPAPAPRSSHLVV